MKNAKKSAPVAMCVKTIDALRLAQALVKKGKHDTYRIQQIVRGKVGVHVGFQAISGLQRSHRYQVGKALSMVM
jgi:hypothetical protein